MHYKGSLILDFYSNNNNTGIYYWVYDFHKISNQGLSSKRVGSSDKDHFDIISKKFISKSRISFKTKNKPTPTSYLKSRFGRNFEKHFRTLFFHIASISKSEGSTKSYEKPEVLCEDLIAGFANVNRNKVRNVRIQEMLKDGSCYKYSFGLGKSSSFFNIFNINFLKKERSYCKLKYSRTPKFDIVSGGLAAFLSAFLGFLVSEKFGIELVDSGDFYYLFMYFVFFFYSLRNFFKYISIDERDWGFALSIKFVFSYYRDLVFILSKPVLNFIKRYIF